jgi:hypothetical protein
MMESDCAQLAAIPFDQFMTVVEEAQPPDPASVMAMLTKEAEHMEDWIASVQRE